MEVKVIQEPKYQLTFTAEEMSKLWELVYDADYNLIKHAPYFYRKLEDIRPAGGFKDIENVSCKNNDTKQLKKMTILELAQHLEHVLNNDLVHENTSVAEFIEKYFKYLKS